MFSFEPILGSELKSLDKVRELLDKLGQSEKNPNIDFLFGKKNDEEDQKESFLVKGKPSIGIDVEEPPEKKIKVEKNDNIKIYISALLIECPDLPELWERISNEIQDDNVDSEDISEKALSSLMNALLDKQLVNKNALEYFQSVMIKSILHLKIYERESNESFFDSFLLLYPTSCYLIVSQLVMEPKLASLVIFMLNMDLMSEDQEKTILMKWLSNKFSIESNTLELPEVILSKNTKLYEDTQVIVALSTSFAAGKCDSSEKCAKFAKFLLQVLGKVGSLEEKAAKNFRVVIDRNKTFLRKRLEMEIDKKSSFG